MKPSEEVAMGLKPTYGYLIKKVAQLEAELERKTKCIHIMEDDTACLPENISVTEYVTFLREQLQQAQKELERLQRALVSAEQTLRNLGNGGLSGDLKTIALNASRYIKKALAGE